jgi:hypothetical protein
MRVPAGSWEDSCENKLLHSFRRSPGAAEQSKKSEDSAASTVASTSEKQLSDSDQLQQIRQKVDLLINEYLGSVGPGGGTRDAYSPVFEQIWEYLAASACEVLQDRGALPGSPVAAAHEVAQLLVRKQRDYGTENISRFGRIGLMIRMHDKVARLEHLAELRGSGGVPENESIDDNLMDVIGYSTIGLMWEDQTFFIPLK